MKLVRAGTLATGVFFAFFAVASLALPHPAFAVIHLGDPNTVSLSQGLVGYWPLDGSVTNWRTNTTQDISGSGYTGTLHMLSTSTTPVAGRIGQAFRFNGVSSAVFFPSIAGSVLSTNKITVSAWVYEFDVFKNFNRIVVSDENGNEEDPFTLDFLGSSGQPRFRLSKNGGINASGPTPLSNGKWYLMTGSYDGGAVKLYINGVLTASAATSTLVLDSATPFSVGIGKDVNVDGDAYTANAVIDDVRIYNRALTQGEVAQLYKLGTANVGHANTVALSNGLVGYWPLDGNTINWTTPRNTFYDLSGNGNNASSTGMATSSSPTIGKIGQALTFNGSTSYLDAGQVITASTSQFTVSAWFKPTSLANNSRIVANGHPDVSSNGFELEFDSGGATGFFVVGNGKDNIGASWTYQLKQNNWYHYVGVYDGSNVKAYINGAQVGQFRYTGGLTVSPYDVNIGRQPESGGADYFPGVIDDVRIYNRALSAGEVAQLYKSGAANVAHSNTVISNGLVGYWTFDGPAIDWTTNTFKDISGQGNNATSTGMSTSNCVAGKIGQALAFNGSSSFLRFLPNVPLNNDAVTNTISAWFKTASNGVIVSAQSGLPPTDLSTGSYDPLIYVETNGKLHGGGWIGSAPALESASAVNDNRWHHAALSYDGSNTQKLYLDGNFVASAAGSLSGGGSFWAIGTGWADSGSWPNTPPSSGAWFYFNGSIDDVRFYNRVLSAGEVKQLYLAGK